MSAVIRTEEQVHVNSLELMQENPEVLAAADKVMRLFFEEIKPTFEDMLELQKYMLSDECAEERAKIHTEHYLTDGLYCRAAYLPAGSLVIGYRHAKSHATMLMSGEVTIVTEEGIETFSGPKVWIDPPGVKRAVYSHTNSVFVTTHVTEADNMADIYKELIIPDTALPNYHEGGIV